MCKWPKYALRTVNANQALGIRQPQPSLHHVGLSSCVIAKRAGTTVHMSSRSRVAQNRLKTDETANETICISVCSCASKQKVMVTLVYCMRYSLVKMQVKLHARRQGSQYRPNTNREWYGENSPPDNHSRPTTLLCNPATLTCKHVLCLQEGAGPSGASTSPPPFKQHADTKPPCGLEVSQVSSLESLQ